MSQQKDDMMPFDPTTESDPHIMLMKLEHLALQNSPVLSDEAVRDITRELEEFITRGHYAGPPGGVTVERVGYNPEKPNIRGFFVEFSRLSDGGQERAPVAHFLETFRRIGVDMV